MTAEHSLGVVARISLLSADEIAGRIVATDLAAYRDRVRFSGCRDRSVGGRDSGPARRLAAMLRGARLGAPSG